MINLSDNYYDIAIIDPPYGKNFDGLEIPEKAQIRKNGTQGTTARKLFKKKSWDKKPPGKEYFKEIFRISKNQIIWGGNYFDLPPSRCLLCWDKNQNYKMFSAFEIAWTSFTSVSLMFRYDNKGFMNPEGEKIHPTQKPVALYKWILKNFSSPGQFIFDGFVGSGSIRLACWDFGLNFEGCEIDPDYWQAQEDRFNKFKKQQFLFDEKTRQNLLFKPRG